MIVMIIIIIMIMMIIMIMRIIIMMTIVIITMIMIMIMMIMITIIIIMTMIIMISNVPQFYQDRDGAGGRIQAAVPSQLQLRRAVRCPKSPLSKVAATKSCLNMSAQSRAAHTDPHLLRSASSLSCPPARKLATAHARDPLPRS
jgi:hypothetical protein